MVHAPVDGCCRVNNFRRCDLALKQNLHVSLTAYMLVVHHRPSRYRSL